MNTTSLTVLVSEKLAEARQSRSGRAAHTIHGGHTHELWQTMLALVAEHDLAEHDGHPQVLWGHVCLIADEDSWEGKAGDYVAIPPARHGLHPVEDSVIMLKSLSRAQENL